MQYMKTKKGAPHIKCLYVGRLSMGYLDLNINSQSYDVKNLPFEAVLDEPDH